MRLAPFHAILLIALIFGCAPKKDGRDICTVETVGEETGAEMISVNLLIPDDYMNGAEISNGGIIAINPNCDHGLNVFLSSETTSYLINEAKNFQLIHAPSGSKVADAELFIWRFRDGSEEPRFFVMRVMNLSEPTSLPTFSDEEHFRRTEAVR